MVHDPDDKEWWYFDENSEDYIACAAIDDTVRTVDFRDINNSIKAPNFLVEGLIETSSITMFYGPPFAGKSLLAIDLMVSLVNSNHWLGLIIPKPAEVRYLAWEDANEIYNRSLCVGKHKPDERFDGQECRISAPPPDIFGTYFELWLEREREIYDENFPFVLIIDTLAMAAAGQGDENSSVYMGKVTDKLRRLRDLDVTLIVVHHSGKDATKGMRGHNSLLAAADNVFALKKKSNSNSITMTREASRNGPTGEIFNFELKTETFKKKTDQGNTEFFVPYLKHIKNADAAATKTAMTRPEILVLNSLQRLLETDPTNVGMMFGLTDNHTAVSYALLEVDCIQKNISPNAKSAASSKKAVRRALDKLVEAQLVAEKDGFIWPIGLKQTDTDNTGDT